MLNITNITYTSGVQPPNQSVPLRSGNNFRSILFKQTIPNNSLKLKNCKSTLVQIMAWCQWWPESVLSYDISRSQWVNTLFMNKAENNWREILGVFYLEWVKIHKLWYISKHFKNQLTMALISWVFSTIKSTYDSVSSPQYTNYNVKIIHYSQLWLLSSLEYVLYLTMLQCCNKTLLYYRVFMGCILLYG